MLDVRNLNVWYGVTEVVRDVSFSVPTGSIVALMGGNGAGKTTILNTLSGLLKPRGGELALDGESIKDRHPHDIVVRGLVQVPQGRHVWPGMTVRDNLDLGAVTRKDKDGIRADIEEAFALFPILAERRDQRASSLSGGEQQMLAICRALMAKPRMLLMDEPSAGLSPRIVQEMVAAIRRLHERGLTILLVEQNVGVAGALADTAYVLANGEIAFSTDGAELATNPDVLRSYLGR
ncbi:MAG: ABC transporter ATP-binding protein [Rhodospirillaceae bacterium]|jgi:branched-chain amino acid transport system ATP-binding protein|nr:ABC transporter ATP-binding protein [Rhodospirillaceae bacterium]